MNPTLRNFYTNENEREAVKAYLIESLKEIAIEKSFAGESVVGIPEARQMVDKMFDNLKVAYGKIEEPKIISSR